MVTLILEELHPNIKSSILILMFNPYFYDFANTLSLDAIYDTNLGAIVGMSAQDEYDLFDLIEVQHYLKMLKHLLMVHLDTMWCRSTSAFDDTSLANITTFQKIAQQSTIKGRFFKFKCKITSDDNKVRAKFIRYNSQ